VLLQDVVFSVARRRIDFRTFHPWVEFIVRVVNDGAVCETQANLRRLLVDIIKNADAAAVHVKTPTGGGASVLFQKMMRQRFDATGTGELAHLTAKEQEQIRNQAVLRAFRQGLPQPCAWGGDERGVFVEVEPPPIPEPAPPPEKRFLRRLPTEVTAEEADRISQAAIKSEVQCLAVLAALAVDGAARNVRPCHYEGCQRFTFGNRALRRQHAFCSDEHRIRYHAAHRDKKKRAAAVRANRQIPQVKLRERKRVSTKR
jgi:hypothetical protein